MLQHESKFKHYYDELSYTLVTYDELSTKTAARLVPLLKVHLKKLEKIIEPGMTVLTWQSLSIDAYSLLILLFIGSDVAEP